MGAVMKIRLILAAAASLALAACSGSPTAPGTMRPGARTNDLTCRSGYHVATRADGSESCEADEMGARIAR
jgi:ABC-type glycerol-3-phosphate transport system substrate-binding protein